MLQVKILAALATLDPKNDAQWTSDGAPRIDVLEQLTEHKGLKRADVVAIAPQFTRESPVLPTAAAEPPMSTDSTSTSVVEGAGDTQPDPDDPLIQTEAEVAEPEELGEPDLEAAEQEEVRGLLKQLEEKAEGLRGAINKATNDLQDTYKKIERVASRVRRRSDDPATNQRDIMTYLEGQQRIRAQRYERQQQILQGLDQRLLNPKSPLDSAMARKNLRGAQRPAVPLKNPREGGDGASKAA